MNVTVGVYDILCPNCNKPQCNDFLKMEDGKDEKEFHLVHPEAYRCPECKVVFTITASVIISIEPVEEKEVIDMVCEQCGAPHKHGSIECAKCGNHSFTQTVL